MTDTTRRRLYWLLAISCVVKLLYVFCLTDYSNYLFSDFGGYWNRALERLRGHDTDYDQWAIWPPLPHILLTFFFRVIDLAGLSEHRLEALLVANVGLSTLCVALVYGITLRLCSSSRAAFVVAVLYAFAFPLLYFNAFVMSEHPATAALLGAVWLLLRYPGHIGYVSAAGVLLAVAVGMRPAFGLCALPCGLYVLFAGQFARFSIGRAAAFTCFFFLILGLVVAEVGRISNGQVRGLSANGGVNFYFAQCHTYEVVSTHSIYSYHIIPPSTVTHAENGTVVFTVPFHQQAFYTELGWQCVRAQPGLGWRNLAKFDDVFFGPLLPHVNTAWGFPTLLTPYRWLVLGLTLLLPLGLVCFKSRRTSAAALLYGIVLMVFATQYAFNAEHRYVYPIFGLLLGLNAWIALELYRRWSSVRRVALAFGAGLSVLALGAGARAIAQVRTVPTLIEAQWYRIDRVANAGWNYPLPPPEGHFAVDTLRFPEGRTLRHEQQGEISLFEPAEYFAIRFETCLDVREAEEYEFVVASDDGFELSIDGQIIASHQPTRPYRPSIGAVHLAAGRHRYALSYFQGDGPLGVTAVWRRPLPSGNWMPAVGLRDIGVGDGKLNFLPPKVCDGAQPPP